LGHGTDTLTFTAAALAFIFEKINIPVLIVGSQRSTDRGSTDGAMNLICAAEFITKTDFTGVAICMHNSSNDNKCAILPATKTRKMHTSRRDDFKAINHTPIALVDFKTRKIEFLKEDYKKKSKDDEVIVKDKFCEDIGILETHPVMKHELFEFYAKNYKGFVLEGTGLGHAPTNLGENNLKNYEILKNYIKNGGIVAVTSQCLYGRVHPNVYTNLRRLSDIGCIFCEDMLPETAFIKLAWLLGNYPRDEAKKLMAKNLRGEITERSVYEEDFLE
jgi:glutamyl-tRNA(Gln) amidotransferase subunit D